MPTPWPPTPYYNFNRKDDDIDQRQTGAYLATRLKPTDDLSVILGARVSNYQYDALFHYHVASLQPYDTDDSVKSTGEVTRYAGVVYDLSDVHSVYASSHRDRAVAGGPELFLRQRKRAYLAVSPSSCLVATQGLEPRTPAL
ncbi:TonB-dependent receptor [Pseudomonas monteilii]|nr:TonB-dependent receptor [Pseudomonas monteilii]MCE1009051.1 TonB-dependent receptor [Pseudomonas monteilii]